MVNGEEPERDEAAPAILMGRENVAHLPACRVEKTKGPATNCKALGDKKLRS